MSKLNVSNGEILFNKLYNLWEEAENYTKEDILEVLYDVATDIRMHGSKLGKSLEEEIRRERLNMNLCPDCSSKLHTESHTINSHIIWGKTAEEDETIMVCSDCGWNGKDE